MTGEQRTGTLILGLGNPILSDDRVGIAVARELGRRLEGVEVVEAAIAGISILDVVCGYGKVVVVDSVVSADIPPGTFRLFSLDELGPAVPAVSHHGVGLASTFEVGRLMGYDLPDEVEVYAIGIENAEEFGEAMSPAVEAGVPAIVDAILRKSFGA